MPAHPSAQNIKVAVDAAIFTLKDGALCLLLIQMKKKPHTGRWAIPGGLIERNETAEAAARRILKTQTGVGEAYLEQLGTFDDPKRDPLGRVVSIASYALMPSEHVKLATTAKYADVRWWPVAKLPALAYDHAEIARTALDRLRAKLGYTNVVWSLLPKEFTLQRIQDAYEGILAKPLDKRNFRKKILSLGLLEETGRTERGGAHRPAALYRFKKRSLVYLDIL